MTVAATTVSANIIRGSPINGTMKQKDLKQTRASVLNAERSGNLKRNMMGGQMPGLKKRLIATTITKR